MINIYITRATWIFLLVSCHLTINSKPDWKINPASFEYSMSLTGTALINCEFLNNDNDMIAAFIKGEIRGVQNFSWDFNQQPITYLTIFNNQFSGDTIKFKVYKSSTDEIFDADISIIFTDNKIIGYDSIPYEFNISNSHYRMISDRNEVSANQKLNDTIANLQLLDESNESVNSNWSIIDGEFKDYFTFNSNNIVLLKSLKEITVDTVHLVINASWKNCNKSFFFFLVKNKSTQVNNYLNKEIQLFPNPSSTNLFVRNIDIKEILDIKIINLNGETFEVLNYSSDNTSLLIPINQFSLSSGIYKILFIGTRSNNLKTFAYIEQ